MKNFARRSSVRHLALTLILTFLPTLVVCLPSSAQSAQPWSHGPLQVSANHLYLQHADGTPFFWLGETGWLLPERTDRDEAAYYLRRCAQAGYNVVQVQTINAVPAYNFYGQSSHPFGYDFSRLSELEGIYGYWDHMDYIVDTAARQGIYIGMVCIWGGLVKAGLMDVEQAKAYGTFLANRYKDRPNIIWIIGGDIQGDIKTEVWDTLARTIKAIDPVHLMTYHPRGRYTSAHWFADREWVDFHMFQSGHRAYGQRMGNADYPIPDDTEEDNWMYVDSTWAYRPIKPVIDGEPSYEDIPRGLHDKGEAHWTDADVRRYAYWAVFGGAFGHTYGHNNIMQFIKPGVIASYYADATVKPWYKAMEDPGFNQMQHLKHLMLALPFLDRVRDQSIIEDNGVKYDRLMATRGTDYLLVYNYTGREMKVDLSKVSGKKKNVWWMDAATGHLTYLGEYAGKLTTFPANLVPGTVISTDSTGASISDGVLIAIDTAADYIATDQQNILKPRVTAKKDLSE